MDTRINQDELLELLRKCINSKSYSGHEENMAEILKDFFKENNFDEVYTDKYGNVVGIINGNLPGKTLLFDGHMDTVEVVDEDEWIYPPFAAEEHDGKIYGRGTTDMKGALCAMLMASKTFKESTNKNFPGKICVAGIVHEECFEGVASREVSKKVNPDYVVIGEASNLNLKIGQRGRAEIKLEVFGKAAHSANPDKGINAVYKIMNLIQKIKELEPPHDDILGDGILELTDIKSSPYPGASVVPDYVMATYDRRLLVGETKESVLEPIQKLIDEEMEKDHELKAKVSYAVGKEKCYTGETIENERFFPGWLFHKNDDYIQKVYKELLDMGETPEITQYSFCTNASHYAGEKGIKTLGLGPSRENLAHVTNEYIEIESLCSVAEIYMGIMRALLV